MQRNLIPQLRTLALVAAAAAAVACADMTAPRSPSQNLAAKGKDSSACDLTVRGSVARFEGRGDSTQDTLGRRVPLPGAHVEFFYVAPLPHDSVPHDSVPRDSVPRDSVPRDSVPRDSVPRDSVPHDSVPRDTMLYLRAAASVGDTSHGGGGQPQQPTARATSRGDGSYAVTGLCPGIYRVVVDEPGTQRTITTFVIVRGDMSFVNFTFPPRR